MGEWREGQAAQYDFYVAELDKLIAELDNAEAFCEALGETGMVTETRGYAGGARALRTDLAGRARDLRADPDPPPVTVMPMSLTTRQPRRNPRMFVCGPDDIDESGGQA